MSEVRMCDRCGRVFPLMEEGSEQFSATKFVTNDKGQKITIPFQADSCGHCGIMPSVEPRIVSPTMREIDESERKTRKDRDRY